MRRTYDRERYMDRVALIRELVPDCAITTDIIVGFPGETEADFEQTLAVVEEVGYDSAFTFVFSPRRETEAATMDGQLPHPLKVERMERLLEVVQRRAAERPSGSSGGRSGGAGRRDEFDSIRRGCGADSAWQGGELRRGRGVRESSFRRREHEATSQDVGRGVGTALSQLSFGDDGCGRPSCGNSAWPFAAVPTPRLAVAVLAIFGRPGVGKTGSLFRWLELASQGARRGSGW